MPKKKTKLKHKKRSAPKTLHCSRCSYVTHSGISAMSKHYRLKHPKSLKKRKR